MFTGNLKFCLNEEDLGVAFKSEQLKKGPIFPAIAFTGKGGCTLANRIFDNDEKLILND